ncbi:arginine--tRNA ligase [bacterium]|nr:arginine--tRNA ligase [bacterium]
MRKPIEIKKYSMMNIFKTNRTIVDWLAGRAAELYDVDVVPDVFEPESLDFGDWTTNLPFQLARVARKSPADIATEIVDAELPKNISSAEVAGAGYINFRISKDALAGMVLSIISEPDRWGFSSPEKNVKIQVEFVSANPTGPMNIVSARAAAVGSTIANALRTAGYDVSTEFYLNDAGNQIRLLGESFLARIEQLRGKSAEIPEGGYFGEYLLDYAREYLSSGASENPQEWILKKITSEQKSVLKKFNTEFDVWFSEREFRSSGKVEEVLSRLRDGEHTYIKDGAEWFAASKIADDVEDFVLVKSDGEWAYGLVDIAYHINKFEERGFDIVYTILGPDHHGHRARLETAMKALGHPDKLKVLILQQVNLIENGEKIKMSKRAGKIITMTELIDDVGVDAARYFFLARKMEAHLDFDLDLARNTSDENPVYYIQYAYARIRSIIEFAQNKGFDVDEIVQADLSLLQHPEEHFLIRKIYKYPYTIEKTARNLQPHIIPFYLYDLAKLFHDFYTKHRVVDENEKGLSVARLALIDAVAITIKNGLKICGISAPDKM